MIFSTISKKKKRKAQARSLYAAIVSQARHPEFYLEYGVSDTVDGRFDMILLHAYIVLRRLRGKQTETMPLAQDLFDVLFEDMDRSLREMGTGDLSVPRKVKAMAQAFYGRIRAYDTGLAGKEADLHESLRRNLYREQPVESPHVEKAAAYLRRAIDLSAGWSMDAIENGQLEFGSPFEIGNGAPL